MIWCFASLVPFHNKTVHSGNLDSALHSIKSASNPRYVWATTSLLKPEHDWETASSMLIPCLSCAMLAYQNRPRHFSCPLPVHQKKTKKLNMFSPVYQSYSSGCHVLFRLWELYDCQKTNGQLTHTKDSKVEISDFMLQPGGLYNVITFQFLFETHIEYLLAAWSCITEHVLVQRLLLLWV